MQNVIASSEQLGIKSKGKLKSKSYMSIIHPFESSIYSICQSWSPQRSASAITDNEP